MIHNLLPYAIATLILPFVEWAFHGPARVREENLAFKKKKKYREDLYHKTIALPMVWHTNNHSGETIDRINTREVDKFCVIRNWLYKMLKSDMEKLFKENED